MGTASSGPGRGGAGARPTPAAGAYGLPFEVVDETSVGRLGAALEESSAGAMWDLLTVSAAGSRLRQDAVSWLAMTTRWLDQWRLVAGEMTLAALPGQPA